MSEWISVEDRLPEGDSQEVIVCKRFPNGARTVKTFLYWYGRQFGADWAEVTHWMPLPEPPQ